jgi:hypothetical protein
VTGQIRLVAAEHGFSAPPVAESAPHLLGLERAAGLPADAVARFKAAGVHVSVRGPRIRVAPHLHTTADDVGRLAGVLATL